EAGGKERNNEKTHSLEGVGINARPVRRDDADGKYDARSHDGRDERKEDDNDAAKEGHFATPNKAMPSFHHCHRAQRHTLSRRKFLGRALELTAGSQNIAPTWSANRRGISCIENNL